MVSRQEQRCKIFLSWFNLPRTWNAEVDKEFKSPPEYPYFGCYFFHYFKIYGSLEQSAQKPRSQVAQYLRTLRCLLLSARSAGSCRRPQLTWGSSCCQVLPCFLSWPSEPGSILETLFLIKRFTDLTIFQD